VIRLAVVAALAGATWIASGPPPGVDAGAARAGGVAAGPASAADAPVADGATIHLPITLTNGAGARRPKSEDDGTAVPNESTATARPTRTPPPTATHTPRPTNTVPPTRTPRPTSTRAPYPGP
jgi:hypothetical protein